MPLQRLWGKRARRVSLSILSIFRNRAEVGFGVPPCTLLFLSLQMQKTTSWTRSFLRVDERPKESVSIQFMRESQLWRLRFCNPKWGRMMSNSWVAATQCRKTWSLLSCPDPQREQTGFSHKPQFASLSLTGRRFRFATQKLKACLGTACLNQTAFPQGTWGAVSLINSQDLVIEKLKALLPSGPQQYKSTPASSDGGGIPSSVVLREAREGVRQRGDGRIHSPRLVPSLTVAVMGIPSLQGPDSPTEQIRGPLGSQSSNR